MATIQAVPAAASPRGGGSRDVSVRMPANPRRDEDEEGGAAAKANPPEKQLSRFVRCVALAEWAGNAFGALGFVWAIGVLLGGFCTALNPQDFWFASVIIFIEAFRIFIRSYKLDSQSLFGTTGALRWINSSFLRMLGQPQEGDEVVLIMGLWLNLIHEFCSNLLLDFIINMALLIPWSRGPRRPQKWHKRAVVIAYLLLGLVLPILTRPKSPEVPYFLTYFILPVIIAGMAVLLLNLRHRRIANLTSSPCGRKLISLAKVALALFLATSMLLGRIRLLASYKFMAPLLLFLEYFSIPVSLLVLSLGSLQNHASNSLFGCWIDTVMHIFFLFRSVQPFPMSVLVVFIPGLSSTPDAAFVLLSYMALLAVLLIGNLQIPAAIVQILLSSLRLSMLPHNPHMGYHYNPPPPPDADSSSNMVAAIVAFYVLALCQGSLYIMASILGLLSSFPRRWLVRRSKISGKLGAKAIDLYYEHAYATRMEMGVFGTAARSAAITFDKFAIESLSSSSRDLQVAGLCVLHNILLERTHYTTQIKHHLILRVTRSSTAVSTLFGMLAWTHNDDDTNLIIRLLAARVTAELAGIIRIRSFPGMLEMVSSLLKLTDAVMVLPTNQQGGPVPVQTTIDIANGGISNGGCYSWVSRLWQWMKPEYWSEPEEPTFSHQDSPPVKGMVILEKLARDLDNCAEISKDDMTSLISKTIGIIGYATSGNQSHNDDIVDLNALLVCSSLEYLRRLATTSERIGAAFRHELWNHPFLLTCLARVLQDDHNNQTWEPAIDIIAKLAMDREAGLQIGKIQVITARLLHAFLGRHSATNMYYDQLLRKVSGEALANLALWGTANCSAILDEPGYQVINHLTNMLSDDDLRYVAASLLLNICEHCSANLLLSHLHASEHLSSALTTVMEHMMAAEGKQLESLINLASEIVGVSVTHEAFVSVLESQNMSEAELIQKLLCTLNSRKIPNPEYPRMRRVIVKILISILELCRRTVEMLVEDGMMERLMESLTKIERSPSIVEEYRVFYGNIGVVLEDGEPMSTLVARAKVLLVQHTTQTAGAPRGDHL